MTCRAVSPAAGPPTARPEFRPEPRLVPRARPEVAAPTADVRRKPGSPLAPPQPLGLNPRWASRPAPPSRLHDHRLCAGALRQAPLPAPGPPLPRKGERVTSSTGAARGSPDRSPRLFPGRAGLLAGPAPCPGSHVAASVSLGRPGPCSGPAASNSSVSPPRDVFPEEGPRRPHPRQVSARSIRGPRFLLPLRAPVTPPVIPRCFRPGTPAPGAGAALPAAGAAARHGARPGDARQTPVASD